jgi:hypothetical protein
MTRTKSQKQRAAANRRPGALPGIHTAGTVNKKRFLDGITVGVSMPGSSNSVKSGGSKGGNFHIGTKGARSAPAAITTRKPTRGARMTATEDDAVVTGADFLGFVDVNSHVSGDVRFSMHINPFMLPKSRLAAAAHIYEKWRIRRMTFRYVPSVPTSQAGQLIQYVDYDVTNTLVTSAPDNVSVASAHTKNTPFAVWDNSVVTYGRECPWLFTSNNGVDDRLDSAGLFTVVCVSNFTGSIALGALYVDYEVEFLQGQSMSPSSGFISVGSRGLAQSLVTYTRPMGLTTWLENPLGLVVTTASGGASRLTFPSQSGGELYHITLRYSDATAMTGSPVTSFVTTNCDVTISPGVALSAGTAGVPGTSGTAGNWTFLILDLILYVTAPGAAYMDLSITGGTGGGGARTSYLYVAPVRGIFPAKSLKGRVEELEERLAALDVHKLDGIEATPLGASVTPWGHPTQPPPEACLCPSRASSCGSGPWVVIKK